MPVNWNFIEIQIIATSFIECMNRIHVVWLSNIWYLDQFTHYDEIQRYYQICKFFSIFSFFSLLFWISFDVVCMQMCFVWNDSQSELDFNQETIDWLIQWFFQKKIHIQFEILQKFSVPFGPVWRIVILSCYLSPFLATKIDNKFSLVKSVAENSACSE